MEKAGIAVGKWEAGIAVVVDGGEVVAVVDMVEGNEMVVVVAGVVVGVVRSGEAAVGVGKQERTGVVVVVVEVVGMVMSVVRAVGAAAVGIGIGKQEGAGVIVVVGVGLIGVARDVVVAVGESVMAIVMATIAAEVRVIGVHPCRLPNQCRTSWTKGMQDQRREWVDWKW